MGYRFGYVRKKSALTLDRALLNCAQNDDEQSKEFLYKNYYGYVAGVVKRYVKNEYDAEELVNEVFIKAFRNILRFNIEGNSAVLERSFKAWIARIAANLCIDFLRTKKNMVTLEDIHEAEVKPVIVNVADKLFADEILKLLNGLPEIQRVIFNLYEIEGYSHDEIGKMLKIPDSTSRTYLTRAKQRLRKLYTETINSDYSEGSHR